MPASLRTILRLPGRIDLELTLGPLRRGGWGDPTLRFGPGGIWRATRTPEGPATQRLNGDGDAIEVEAWGDGAAWAVSHAATLLGAGDDVGGFVPRHPVIRDLHRRFGGLRIPRSEAVFESLLPTILGQKVPGAQARDAYRRLVWAYGERAPGPIDLLIPPSPHTLGALPYWAFHRFGIERRRAETIRHAAFSASRLETAVQLAPADARRRLVALPGIGAWSAAEVALVALGDADAVSVGDYHLPHAVSWALAGVPRGSDAQMLELLEPYRGHRGRVLRLLQVGGVAAPRFGPRLPLRDIRRQ